MTKKQTANIQKNFVLKLVIKDGVSAWKAWRHLSIPKSTIENWKRALKAGNA